MPLRWKLLSISASLRFLICWMNLVSVKVPVAACLACWNSASRFCAAANSEPPLRVAHKIRLMSGQRLPQRLAAVLPSFSRWSEFHLSP